MLGQKFLLVGEASTGFSLRLLLAGIVPLRIPSLADIVLTFPTIDNIDYVGLYSAGAEQIIGRRFDPVPVPEAWLNRIGEYEPTNAIAGAYLQSTQIAYRDGFLLLDGTVMGTRMLLPLDPISDSEALTAGVGRVLGETVSVRNVDGVEIIAFSGYELRPTGN
jgi:hypothetical protein